MVADVGPRLDGPFSCRSFLLHSAVTGEGRKKELIARDCRRQQIDTENDNEEKEVVLKCSPINVASTILLRLVVDVGVVAETV
jgi:hypothetical protein